MYLPKHFAVLQFEAITNFVATVGVVDLVTVNEDGQPISSLLPCIWDTTALSEDNHGTLIMHMAKANAQWKSIRDGSAGLAIVHGFNAYISPSNYLAKKTDHRVVPTWNYQSVHLSGTVEVSHDLKEIYGIVSSLTNFHEADRNEPWSTDDADPKYLEGQLKAIVAIKMAVNLVEAKDKLSQNRPLADQGNIVADLSNSKSAGAREIANEMGKRLGGG